MTQLHYELSGAAHLPVLVLGDSLGTTTAMWQPQWDALSAHFRLLRYDHRGHGGSPAPVGPYTIADLGGDVLALLDSLSLQRVSYCGLSVGGMVGMWLAANAPDRVDRLAVLCTSARFDEAQPWLDRAATVRACGMTAIAESVVARWFTPAFRERNPATVEEFFDMLTSTDTEGYAGMCEALAALDLRPDLPKILAPTLVISAEQDPAIPPAHGRVIADAVDGARFVILDKGAHIANVEAVSAVTGLLLEHFLGDEDPYAAGLSVRRAVLGTAHVDRATASADEFTAEFQQLITRYAWGSIWTRPGLDRRTRSCITLAMLATLHHDDELAMHVRAAVRNGLTRDEIKEVLLQVAIYAGVPAANRAFAVAQRTFAALDEP